jgi:uncharacterized protein
MSGIDKGGPGGVPPSDKQGIEGVTFDSDGNSLVGVLYTAQEKGPATLFLHGCPGLEKNQDLRSYGHNSLVFHYRGCWGSHGAYDLRTITADVSAAVTFLAAHPMVDPDRISVVGHSMGGWAAILSAARDPRLKSVAVYGSAVKLGAAMQVTEEQVEQEFTRFLATTPAEFIAQSRQVPSALDVVDAISPRPLLVIHGTDDTWVPVQTARELGKHATRYIEVPGANHGFTYHRTELRDLITDWLEETCG